MQGLKLNLTSNSSLNLSGLSKGDIQRIVAAVEAALQDDFDLINQKMDTNTNSVNSTLNNKINIWTESTARSRLTVPSSNAGLKTIDYLVYETAFLQREGDILIANNQLYRCCSVEYRVAVYSYTGNYLRIATGEDVNTLSLTLEDYLINVENSLDTKADKSETQALQTQADNNSSDITSLQTQIGDIATILADIRADQEALINGGEE